MTDILSKAKRECPKTPSYYFSLSSRGEGEVYAC
jgi:hypothetical protein